VRLRPLVGRLLVLTALALGRRVLKDSVRLGGPGHVGLGVLPHQAFELWAEAVRVDSNRSWRCSQAQRPVQVGSRRARPG